MHLKGSRGGTVIVGWERMSRIEVVEVAGERNKMMLAVLSSCGSAIRKTTWDTKP